MKINQVLEDVCAKQGYSPSAYDLKHHNHIVDLTSSMRFSNLPNKATLELVEAENRRVETNVTIGLMLEDGDRRTADFSPNTSLLDLIIELAPNELKLLHNPTIMYMRQEVAGVPALREKTLRQLGLLKGRAILRLLNKAEVSKQANVSAVYRVPLSEKPGGEKNEPVPVASKPKNTYTENKEPKFADTPGPSKIRDEHTIDPVKLIKQLKNPNLSQKTHNETLSSKIEEGDKMEIDVDSPILQKTSSYSLLSKQENLERRLRIEEEVTFLGGHKAVAFLQPDDVEEEIEDLSDDFYELSVDEVRRLYKELQKNRIEYENTPLMTTNIRQDLENQTSQQKLASYKNVVVRIQFPDSMLLQGIFEPTNTIGNVISFIKEYLVDPNKPFNIFTTPFKEPLDPKMTLLEAKFVPCVHMHFKWQNENCKQPYLKHDVYARLTSSEAASILASKYRAPTRRRPESPGCSRSTAGASTSTKSSKAPKWFKA